MEIHLNQFGIKHEIKESAKVKFPPFISKNHQLSSSLVYMHQLGVPQDETQFKALVEAVLRKYSPKTSYEGLIDACINDGHIKNEKEARYVTFSNDAFLFDDAQSTGMGRRAMEMGMLQAGYRQTHGSIV